MKLATFLSSSVAALALLAGPAHADLLQLRIIEGANQFDITDGQSNANSCLNDGNGVAGVITVLCSSGVWLSTVTTGAGGNALPGDDLDLNSIVVSSSGPGTIELWLTERFCVGSLDCTGPTTGATVDWTGGIGGTTQGTIEYWAYGDDNLFFAGSQLIDSGMSGGFAFADLLAGSVTTGDGLYAVALRVLITHQGAGTTSFDFQMHKVPEPGTLALFGLGLLGLGVARRRNHG